MNNFKYLILLFLLTSCEDKETQDTVIITPPISQKEVNIANQVALRQASQNGQLELVQDLFKKKVDIDAQDTNGMTALMFASSKGHVKVVEVLLKNGAKVDIKNKANFTALDFVTAHGSKAPNKEEIKKLLDKYWHQTVEPNKYWWQ